MWSYGSLFQKRMVCLLAIIGLANACRSTQRQPVTSELRVVGGSSEDLSFQPEVVALVRASDNARSTCTGTFLTSEILLTAAHCVPDAELEQGRLVDSSLTLARSPREFSQPVVSGFFVRHPKYRKSEPFHDLALVQFDSGTSLAWAHLGSSAPLKGDTVYFVGFGRSNYSQDGKGTGIKQKGTNTIALLDRGQTIRIESTLKPKEDFREGLSNLNTGDSGGPLFNNAGELIGVASIVVGPRLEEDRLQHAYGFFTNINEPSNRQFIDSYLNGEKKIEGKVPAHGYWSSVEPPLAIPFCQKQEQNQGFDGFYREEFRGQKRWCRNPDAEGARTNLLMKKDQLPRLLFQEN